MTSLHELEGRNFRVVQAFGHRLELVEIPRTKGKQPGPRIIIEVEEQPYGMGHEMVVTDDKGGGNG